MHIEGKSSQQSEQILMQAYYLITLKLKDFNHFMWVFYPKCQDEKRKSAL